MSENDRYGPRAPAQPGGPVAGPDGELPVAGPDRLRVARVLPSTGAEGPGLRTAVWVQGCSIRCRGCFNPRLWSAAGGEPTAPGELLAIVLNAGTEGVTLLGGEPFDQAAPLSVLAGGVRSAGLSVVTFTGYSRDRLVDAAAAGRRDIADLLQATDLLIDGPYLADRPDPDRPWVGSTNQRFCFLTDRYRDLGDRLGVLPDRIEVRIGADGTVAVNGWADPDALVELLEGL
jgi:anaerobic ribonucleoside-triphosphate reductase activating protein